MTQTELGFGLNCSPKCVLVIDVSIKMRKETSHAHLMRCLAGEASCVFTTANKLQDCELKSSEALVYSKGQQNQVKASGAIWIFRSTAKYSSEMPIKFII